MGFALLCILYVHMYTPIAVGLTYHLEWPSVKMAHFTRIDLRCATMVSMEQLHVKSATCCQVNVLYVTHCGNSLG